MTDIKPYRHRFRVSIIQHAIWLSHRVLLSDRDVEELLHQPGIGVSHEPLREWCLPFGSLFTEALRHRVPRRGTRWHLIEVGTSVDGVRHWLWRAVDKHGFVQGILLGRHRDTDAAKTFLTQLLGEYDVPEVIHNNQLRSYGAAIRARPSLLGVDHQQVISLARGNNLVEQSHRPTRRQERGQQGMGRKKRAQEVLKLHARVANPHHHTRRGVAATHRRSHQQHAFPTWSMLSAGVA
ncbi:IS6 family transposase [Deinococcus sp. QL22]|uniref:IS6 family transposase n=1 Tax=Deinococcus sp. QL22 TaxID=2939437 RepID=UPI002017B69A|nr:IS6 family transposase [Deinococcus sp. QL22]UQN08914.1 IS6 family transposase [Deinococcus sp. QL22]